jgi:hypothetical protein
VGVVIWTPVARGRYVIFLFLSYMYGTHTESYLPGQKDTGICYYLLSKSGVYMLGINFKDYVKRLGLIHKICGTIWEEMSESGVSAELS